jgi:hypothetical protein
VAEHLNQDILLAIEVVVRVHNLIRKHPFLLVFLEFADLDEEVANVLDELLQGHEGYVGGVVHKFGQDRVLAMRVAVKQIDDTQEQCLVKQFCLAEQIFLEDGKEEL